MGLETRVLLPRLICFLYFDLWGKGKALFLGTVALPPGAVSPLLHTEARG